MKALTDAGGHNIGAAFDPDALTVNELAEMFQITPRRMRDKVRTLVATGKAEVRRKMVQQIDGIFAPVPAYILKKDTKR